MMESLKTKHTPRLYFGWLLIAVTLVASVVVLFLGVYGLTLSREYMTQNAGIQTKNLVRAINQNITATFKRINFLLLLLSHEIEIELLNGKIDQSHMKKLLAFEDKYHLKVVDIGVTNAEGQVILDNTSRDFSVNFADQPYFSYLRDHPEAGMFITKPMTGVFTKQWVISFARRYNLPDGRFGGVVTTAIFIEHFQKALSGFDVGLGGMLTLRDDDGGFVAREPFVVKGKVLAIGDKTFSPELHDILASGVWEKTYVATAPFDQTKRTLTFQRIESAPFFVVASLAEEDYLRQWYRNRVIIFTIIAVFLLVIWTLVWLLWRTWTSRGQAEASLKESEAKFRNIFDNSAVGKSITYLNGTINANPAFYQMLGYTKEELSQRTWQSLTHPEDIEWSKKNLDSLHSGEKNFVRFRKRYLKKDGGILWADVNTVLQKDKEGNPLYYITALVDITDLKRAEEALRESEETYRMLYESLNDALFTAELNPDGTLGKFFLVNDIACQRLGYSREELLSKTPADLNSEKTGKMLLSRIQKILKEKHVTLETEHVTKDGRIIPVELTTNVTQFRNRTIFHSIARDISERKRAEEAILLEKERLAVTLRSIGDGVITTDTFGNIMIMNKVAEELTGWKQEEVFGKPLISVFRIFHEFTRQPCENPVEKVLTNGKIIELANHTVLVSRDGTERGIADSAAPIRDNKDQIIGVVLVIRDTTEKQKLLDSIQRAGKLESLGVLAGGIAHDFNNLMTGIFGNIELAKVMSPDNNVLKYLDEAISSLDMAKGLTSQLLTFSKGGEPVRKVQPLLPFIHNAVEFALSGSNVSYVFPFVENLWNCNFDKSQINQVISNIVINAKEAMPRGGTLEIATRNIFLKEKEHLTLAPGHYVKISIKDSGIGIPKDLFPRIFDPFFTTKTTGHGLGLAICYSILNRHEGCIDLESEQGVGSTFHIYLPASLEAVSEKEQKSAVRFRGSGRILIMEDEKRVLEVSEAMLTALGYSVIGMSDGRAVLDFFIAETKAGRNLAAMIFDLTIKGGMGGKETIAEIRKLNPKIPVFVASGYANDPVMANPHEYGFTGSLSKPFRMSELGEILKKYLDNLNQEEVEY